jgi:molybdopterin-guanine dinucleotide biosynthesis protein A
VDKSAIILAGGSSSRFGQDKGVLELADKPLIRHVVDAVRQFVDEVIVVTSSQKRLSQYAKLLPANVQFAVDACEANSPLVGALTGFGVARGKYALLVGFDMPFVSGDAASLLFDLCTGKAAVIPRWPNGQTEPLHSVYQTKMALDTAKSAVNEGKLNMHAMIEKLRGVRYVSTLVLQQLDPDFKTFFSVNTPVDLKKATAMIKPKRNK